MNINAIVIDTETSSLYGEVIEVAWAACDATVITEVFSERFKPSKMDPSATAVHRIHPKELANCPPSRLALTSVPDADYWIGHNVVYDWTRLGRPKGVRLICTQMLAGLHWPKISSYKLSALYLHVFGIGAVRDLDGLHEAATDILLCWKILRRICEETHSEISDLPYLSHPSDWINK